MAVARSIKVSREKLIELLKAKQADYTARRLAQFEQLRSQRVETLKSEIVSHQQSITYTEEQLKEWEAAKKYDDLTPEQQQYLYRYDNTDSLGKQIQLLELSDELTINVGPTSELAQYL